MGTTWAQQYNKGVVLIKIRGYTSSIGTNTVSKLSMLSSGIEFNSFTMCGLGDVPTCFFGSIAVLFPCKMFLKEGPPFICFSLAPVFFEVLPP